MHRLMHTAGLAALAGALLMSAPALAQNGHGKGPDGPRGHEARGGPQHDGPGRGGPERGGPGRGPERADRGGPAGPVPSPDRILRDQERQLSRRVEAEGRDVDRDIRRQVEAANRGWAPRPDRGVLQGCPPGLARRDNGCLPPGQARRIAQAVEADRWDYLWRRQGDDYRYRYDNGYLYRLNPQGGLLGYLPVLGGVLSPGNVWPAQYAYDPTPDYVTRYYGLSDRYQYRYADGVVYAVDPQSQSINQVAALLTGQSFNVGQRMPSGYDVYNVPYAYRGQYVDGPDRWYRYNDGYVYQVDPTTQLVQAAIQLLT